MHARWLLVGTIVLASVLAGAAIACGDGEEEAPPTPSPTAALPTLEPSPTPEAATTPTEGATPGVSGETLKLTLAEVAASGVTGSATLTPADGTTEVSVSVEGLPGEGPYLLHIHQGTCQQQGPFVQALEDLAPDAAGSAESTSSVNRSLDTLTSDAHYLVVFDQNTPLACADIEVSS